MTVRKSRLISLATMLAGALLLTNTAHADAPSALPVDADSFKCLDEMKKVRHFYVDNLLGDLDADTKEAVRKELGWLGFGALSTSTLAHPAPDKGDLDVTLRRLGVADELVVMSAQTETNQAAMRKLAQSGWALDDIDAGYASFVKRFRPLIAAYGKNTEVSARTAFLVRTLLIQEYRKVLLRDPQLPAELLPSDWHGTAAYQLCRNLYRALCEAADDYLSAVMETADGPLPPPNKRYFQRFGGLRTA